MQDAIDIFLAQPAFAVAGASANRSKYGNKVLRAYQQQDKLVYPINRKGVKVEGLTSLLDVASLPDEVTAISIVTPPVITRHVVEAAVVKGIKHIWMQPGAEDQAAIAMAKDAGASVIHGGPCLLVAVGYRE